jgi:hypothetical protein
MRNWFMEGTPVTPEYRAWQEMLSRCYCETHGNYAYYGGRGIKVCSRWRRSFSAFRADMGRKPTAGHSLDRWPDQSGDYSPRNCRWATKRQQQRNLRSNRLLTFRGKTQCLTAWADYTGLTQQALSRRLARGWTVAATLTTPRRDYPAELARRGKSAVLSRGGSPERALT